MTDIRLKYSEIEIGQEVTIPAWWNNNEPTLCKILKKYHHEPEFGWAGQEFYSITVRPLEGNPHSRYVLLDKEFQKGTSS